MTAQEFELALVQIIDGKLTYQVRSKDPVEICYPLDFPKYTAIAQYKVNKATIGCSDVIRERLVSLDTECSYEKKILVFFDILGFSISRPSIYHKLTNATLDAT